MEVDEAETEWCRLEKALIDARREIIDAIPGFMDLFNKMAYTLEDARIAFGRLADELKQGDPHV